jgi:hypothetical protein
LKFLSKTEISKYKQEQLRSFLFEKEIGQMANECRFLVKTIGTFQTEVIILFANRLIFNFGVSL